MSLLRYSFCKSWQNSTANASSTHPLRPFTGFRQSSPSLKRQNCRPIVHTARPRLCARRCWMIFAIVCFKSCNRIIFTGSNSGLEMVGDLLEIFQVSFPCCIGPVEVSFFFVQPRWCTPFRPDWRRAQRATRQSFASTRSHGRRARRRRHVESLRKRLPNTVRLSHRNRV